jgi:16S rRNA (cytosine967-C5)-methyltransferase
MVVAMLHPEQGDSVLDCCSAPGGKTLFAASRMKNKGSIIALDSVESRLGAVKNAAAKQGYGGMIQCIASDARQFCENSALSGDMFDKVLVDAPCSGTGVLSKRADLRWRRKEDDVKTLTKLQLDLLHAASKVVRPGGYLMYSTCSIEKVENIDISNAFLQQHQDFELVHGSTIQGIPPECLDEHGCLQMLPHRHGTDGAFAAKFRKKM